MACSAVTPVAEVLKGLVKQRWELAGRLLQKAIHLKHQAQIRGMQRTERKIKAERAFLESLLSGTTELKEQHVSSSNLLHLEAVLHICEHAVGVTVVQQTFCYVPLVGSNAQTVLVDVVANEGSSWVRVFARNRRALHQKWLGDGNFGDKSVTDLAQDFMEASRQNPHRFENPKVIFAFFDGITKSIASELHALEVHIVGPVFDDDSTEQAPTPLEVAAMFRSEAASVEPLQVPRVEVQECDRVNLDVSTMLAWASAMTHGGAHYHFEDPIIEEQAQEERANPLWPVLLAAINGKKLLACRTAIDSFKSIVATVGGLEEKQRSSDVLSQVEVVDDVPSDRAMKLECTGKIKPRAKIIFGTGDTLKAVTLTANEAFVRAAAHQGVCFDVFVHPSRALTEAKQPKFNFSHSS